MFSWFWILLQEVDKKQKEERDKRSEILKKNEREASLYVTGSSI